MHRNRKAKIVATLGPATPDRAGIEALFRAGVDVFRLNFSHGSHADHQTRARILRDLERDSGRPISILLDLQGPKLRIGTFGQGPIQLQAGQPFELDLQRELPGDEARVALPHPEIFAALTVGSDLLLDDGRVRLRVERCDERSATTRVITGGPLSDRKGVNVPDVVLPLSALTEKDRADLEFGLKLDVDWVALSFVQRPEDIEEVKALVAGRAGVIAKLEKPAAILQLDAIVEASDAIMVARGDLGVEMPAEQVPSIQKRIVRECRRRGRPVIVATQMLDSMVAAPVPTRAEASDVATAIYDGADAVMLSAESASGLYPVEAVSIMDRIICQTETDPLLPRCDRDGAHGAGPQRDRCHRLRHAQYRRRHAGRRHRRLYHDRTFGPAHGARTSAGSHPRHDAAAGNRAPAGAGLGGACLADPRRGRCDRDDRLRLPRRPAGGLRRKRRHHRDFGRPPLRHPGRDQSAAHRRDRLSPVPSPWRMPSRGAPRAV